MADQKEEKRAGNFRGAAFIDVDWTIVRAHSHNLIRQLMRFYFKNPGKEITPELRNAFITDLIDRELILASEQEALEAWMTSYATTHQNKSFDSTNTEIIRSILKILPTTGTTERWKSFITRWRQAGGIVNLVTFSSFKDDLPSYFEHLGLPKMYIERDCEPAHLDKNHSIDIGIKNLGDALSSDALIVFCDDDEKNTNAAENPTGKQAYLKGRIKIIPALDTDKHLDDLEAQLAILQEKAKTPAPPGSFSQTPIETTSETNDEESSFAFDEEELEKLTPIVGSGRERKTQEAEPTKESTETVLERKLSLPTPAGRTESRSPDSKDSPFISAMDFPITETPTLVIDMMPAPSDTDKPTPLRHSEATLNLRALRSTAGSTETPVHTADRPNRSTYFGRITVHSPLPRTPEPATPTTPQTDLPDPKPGGN